MTGSILSRFHRTGEHFTGESVADLKERRERERATEMAARQQWPVKQAVEIARPTGGEQA